MAILSRHIHQYLKRNQHVHILWLSVMAAPLVHFGLNKTGLHFVDTTAKYNSMEFFFRILILMSLNFVHMGPI